MRIIPISQQECGELLQRVSIGRLACSWDGQPYIVPVAFACGKTPKVCLQADEIGHRPNWISVVVTGTYFELDEIHYPSERDHAMEQLAQYSEWWETPLAERRENTSDLAIETLFFRIDIQSMSGLRAISEAELE